jgi:hypothetical protein
VFDIFCTGCDRRRLVSPGQVTGIVNAPGGIAVQYRCVCGHLGVWITGRKHEAAVAAA